MHIEEHAAADERAAKPRAIEGESVLFEEKAGLVPVANAGERLFWFAAWAKPLVSDSWVASSKPRSMSSE